MPVVSGVTTWSSVLNSLTRFIQIVENFSWRLDGYYLDSIKMMDPLLTVPVPSLSTSLPSSVITRGSCKLNNGHPSSIPNEETIKQTTETILISVEDLKDLLEFFSKSTYKARDTQPKVMNELPNCEANFILKC